jgi:hypothetical protein
MSTKSILIVSPHFPPSNAADMHRVRAVLPFLQESGWNPALLAVSADCVHVPRDEWLANGLPEDIPIHRAQALGLTWARIPGLGNIDFRALGALRRLGNQLCSKKRFDLIYFSTTAFGLHVLGPYWKRRFGIPFAMDYQDPWVSDYYREHSHVVPPGGRLKYGLIDRISRYQEPRVLRQCAGITAVSPSYPEQLRKRYPWLASMPAKVLPFPGVGRDFTRIQEETVTQTLFPINDGLRHWVYVGRGGDDMAPALSGFFQALRQWRATAPECYNKTRLHFIGTSYAAAGKGTQTVLPIAEKFNVADIVSESTDRVTYRLMLRCLLDADALIVPGSNDPAYTASKLYPYLLARKPLLAVFHESSSVVDVLSRVGGAQLIQFNASKSTEQIAAEVNVNWLKEQQYEQTLPLNELVP